MCTLSWRHEPEILEVWFNRDEQRTRPDALPPTCLESDNGLFCSPIDPKGGGSWIFVNQHGVIGALLNFYEATPPDHPLDQLRSRGLLIRDLAASRNLTELESSLHQQVNSHLYAPFYMWTASRNTPVSFWAWDGHHLEGRSLELQMHTTSSHKTEEVCAHRKEVFRKTVTDLNAPSCEELRQFHENGKWDGNAWSVHMSRKDARTVSTSRIQLTAQEALFTYRTPESEEPHQTSLALNLAA